MLGYISFRLLSCHDQGLYGCYVIINDEQTTPSSLLGTDFADSPYAIDGEDQPDIYRV